mmetsp:Transcript_25893/g.24757  ORF Transcript_25893/g.24757 Transcript_25893/m.24757 type:complete len:122 (-) Transcript_25893:117-482(-)
MGVAMDADMDADVAMDTVIKEDVEVAEKTSMEDMKVAQIFGGHGSSNNNALGNNYHYGNVSNYRNQRGNQNVNQGNFQQHSDHRVSPQHESHNFNMNGGGNIYDNVGEGQANRNDSAPGQC